MTSPVNKVGGNPKMKMLSHIETGVGNWKASEVEMEQEPSRPYVYVSGFTGYNLHMYDVRNPAAPKEVFTWTIEDPALHQGVGAMDGKYFKTKGRYYFVQTFQFTQAGPDSDLGAIVFDVTGLPDGSKVKEVARIRYPKAPGGFHNSYAYKHSDGRVLLFTHVNAPQANIYDMDKVVAGGDPATWMISAVPNATPDKMMSGGYHDFFVGYDANSRQDKFYGAGMGGYSVYDITKVEDPKLLFTITGNGVSVAHTLTPTPDHKFAVTEIEYQYTPLKIYDLQQANEGKVKNITQPISAWAADWRDLSHNHEVRWPYVFVSAYEDGLQVFEMKDPKHPKTVGWWYTCNCEHETGFGGTQANGFQGTSVMNGAFGIDVRNYDGLIAIADMKTGLWLFKMDGFNSWNGNDVGMPNISSVQDWDNGPVKQAAMKRPAT